MAINRNADGMREVFALVGVQALRAADDHELLQRFVTAHDEAAFRVIAERHGPMVLGVCRRVLSCQYDAEDALQATFLVFARKAVSVRNVSSLAGWLHGVATRVATTLRRDRRRRRVREQAASTPPVGEPRDELSWAEVKSGLDEELARLSAAHREVLVLCCLEGQTRDEAAQQLGVAVGVVKGRLERARKVLAARLARRGLALSAGLFAVGLSSEAAAVSVRVSALVSDSPPLSPAVLTLANRVMQGVAMSQLKQSATGLLAVLALVGGTAFALAHPADARQLPAREWVKAPVPKATPPEGVILASRLSFKPPGDVLEVMGTDGKHQSFLPVGDLMNVQRARVSPDGKRLAFVRFIPLKANQRGDYHYPQDVYVVDLPLTEAPKEPTFKGVLDPYIAWAPDGKAVYVSSIPDDADVSQAGMAGKTMPRKTVRYDATAKKEKAIELPHGHEVHDVSPDGKTLLTRIKVWNGGFGKTGYSSFLVPLDTLKSQAVGEADDGFEIARFSPDGTRVVGIRGGLSKSKEPGVYLADVGTGKVEPVPLAKEVAAGLDNGCVAWAPDGKRLAVMWEGPAKGGPRGGGGGPGGGGSVKRIMVVGADGKDEKVIREFGANDSVLHIEWADPKLTEPKKEDPRAKLPGKELIKAPVPVLKANPPEKLDRVPAAPPELRKELAGWDATYRHGGEEKFAELEKRAEELAKGCESDHDRARVWYAVAHIAGQSGIDRQADRVRKYAERCLKISRDPLDRAYLYSYLASCEEVGKGEFADKRRKAAGWLLTGYRELLVQELPDTKPELPRVNARRLDEPQGQGAARQAAQLEAREQAVWVSDQIDRRDTLVLHFRNLYEPHPKAHGHGPDGPDQLRKLAAAKLPTAADVDTLLTRVLPAK
jgi:RNA polymerase sigma factor (sigma-70 family)